MNFDIRPFAADQLNQVVKIWHQTKKAAYPYLPLEQERRFEDDLAFFSEFIRPRCALWLAFSKESGILGFLAIQGDYIDRLYIHPRFQSMGVGSALIKKAKTLSPKRLELHTHQANQQGRGFYEAHGFQIVEFGISPPPESAPDIRYLWTGDRSD